MDATDNRLLATQYYGCWVLDLYNHGRPHSSLGPGIPDVPPDRFAQPNGHHIPAGHRVIATSILAGLHHEYRLELMAA